jgi:hypothetical protein
MSEWTERINMQLGGASMPKKSLCRMKVLNIWQCCGSGFARICNFCWIRIRNSWVSDPGPDPYPKTGCNTGSGSETYWKVRSGSVISFGSTTLISGMRIERPPVPKYCDHSVLAETVLMQNKVLAFPWAPYTDSQRAEAFHDLKLACV